MEKQFDPVFGARPLRRAIQKHLEYSLAFELLRGRCASDCDVSIDWPEGSEKLVFTFSPHTRKKLEKAARQLS